MRDLATCSAPRAVHAVFHCSSMHACDDLQIRIHAATRGFMTLAADVCGYNGMEGGGPAGGM